MSLFDLDTSALVKRYRTSGILRLLRGRQLSQDTTNEILARFRRDVRELFRVWPLNDEIAIDAVTAVGEHGLRSADAIHLATAQKIASLTPGAQVVMVSSDRELLDAATTAGLIALDPPARGSAENQEEPPGPAPSADFPSRTPAPS